jgi:hypothetical protein
VSLSRSTPGDGTGVRGRALWQMLPSGVKMVLVVGWFRYLAVVLCTVAVLTLGLVALFSTGSTGSTASGGTECVSPAQPPPVSAKTAVVPNVVEISHRGGSVDLAICRAGLNDTTANAPAQPNGRPHCIWPVVSQAPVAGSVVPKGSVVVLTVRGC